MSSSGGVIDGGRFEIAYGRVKALLIRSEDEEKRFERK